MGNVATGRKKRKEENQFKFKFKWIINQLEFVKPYIYFDSIQHVTKWNNWIFLSVWQFCEKLFFRIDFCWCCKIKTKKKWLGLLYTLCVMRTRDDLNFKILHHEHFLTGLQIDSRHGFFSLFMQINYYCRRRRSRNSLHKNRGNRNEYML